MYYICQISTLLCSVIRVVNICNIFIISILFIYIDIR